VGVDVRVATELAERRDGECNARSRVETKAAVGNFTMGCGGMGITRRRREQVVFNNRAAFDNSLESEQEVLSGGSS